MSDDDQDYRVGYGKPPRRTQFKKGQSGNPEGARRKKKQDKKEIEASIPRGQFPTSKAIREEALRMVTVRDGDERQQIGTREAVIRAVATKAMQGGILAQRTFVEWLKIEDELKAKEDKESFDFWLGYVHDCRTQINEALASGRESPEFLPHPDDIKLGYSNLTVEFTGPVDEAQAKDIKRLRRLADLQFELAIFYGEDISYNGADLWQSRVGIWMVSYLSTIMLLPARMRGMSDTQRAQMDLRMMLSRRAWEAYLGQECAEFDLPFIPARKDWPTKTLAELGIDELVKAHRQQAVR